MRRCIVALLACVALGCGGAEQTPLAEPPPPTPAPKVTTCAPRSVETASGETHDTAKPPTVTIPDGDPPGEAQATDLVVGTGAEAKAGSSVSVHYVGVAWSTKQEFDSSWTSERPFAVSPLGRANVIRGWNDGIQGMRAGGRRRLVLPPACAYGEDGYPPDIKPNETLVFVVDVVSVR